MIPLIPLLLLLIGPAHCWWHFGSKAATAQHQKPEVPKASLPEGVDAAELRMPGVSPQRNDTYMCSSFAVEPEQDHYLVGFEPLADSHHIHHIIIYGCEMPGSGDEAWDCGEMASPQGRYGHSPVCASQPDIIYAWAHDAPELVLPPGVGFRVGGASKHQFLVLQVHYMGALRGDQSGIRVLSTDEPQPRLASTLLLATDGRMEPRKTEQLDVACVVDEPVELHPFAFRVHTHRHGQMVGGWLVQEDPETGRDRWTLLGERDPQLPQLFRPVANQSLVVSQGDVLAARCKIRNDEKREIKIGPTGEDEMCNFYLMYWTEGDQELGQNTCFSPGPPTYRWTSGAGLNHVPQ